METSGSWTASASKWTDRAVSLTIFAMGFYLGYTVGEVVTDLKWKSAVMTGRTAIVTNMVAKATILPAGN